MTGVELKFLDLLALSQAKSKHFKVRAFHLSPEEEITTAELRIPKGKTLGCCRI